MDDYQDPRQLELTFDQEWGTEDDKGYFPLDQIEVDEE
jgi:hypothetical protein